MSEATLLKTGARPVLRFERRLPRTPEALWRSIADPVEMRSWFPTRIEIEEWKIGAPLTHYFDFHQIDPLPGRVLEWDPPRRASFTWGNDAISVDLTPSADGGTVLVLTEELDAKNAARNAAGWDGCLDRLEHGKEREQWRARFDRYVRNLEPVLGPQDGPPDGIQGDP